MKHQPNQEIKWSIVMLRKITSTVLTASFIALVSSGIIMLSSNSLLLQFKMHPIHNIFGLLMIVFGVFHVVLNYKALKIYFKQRSIIIISFLLAFIMIGLLLLGLNRPFDPTFISIITKCESDLIQLKNNKVNHEANK